MPAVTPARLLRVVAAAFILAAPCPAIAGDPAAEGAAIRWSAPPECPTVEQLRAEIGRLARPQARATRGAEVTAEVTRDAAGPYRLRLVITDRQGGIRERRLDGETCAEVANAAAVVIALASDDDDAIPAAPPPIPPPPASAPPPQRSDPSRAPAAPRPAAWEISALGGVDFASLPAPAPGFGFGAAFDFGANRVELRATAWLPQRATLIARSVVGGDVALYAGALRYCRSLFEGTFDLAPCAGFEAGVLVASGVGVASPVPGVGPWLAPELGLAGAIRPSSRLALSLELDGLVPLARDRFVITSAGRVFEPPPVTGHTLLGLHVRFP